MRRSRPVLSILYSVYLRIALPVLDNDSRRQLPLEGEQAFGEALFEDGEGFGGGGQGGGSWPEMRPRGHLLVTLSRSKPGEYTLIN